jgi:hypothetical protein
MPYKTKLLSTLKQLNPPCCDMTLMFMLIQSKGYEYIVIISTNTKSLHLWWNLTISSLECGFDLPIRPDTLCSVCKEFKQLQKCCFALSRILSILLFFYLHPKCFITIEAEVTMLCRILFLVEKVLFFFHCWKFAFYVKSKHVSA